MPRTTTSPSRFLNSLVLCSLAFAGCGNSNKTIVEGKLTLDGTWNANDWQHQQVFVILTNTGDTPWLYTSEVRTDGSFRQDGGDGSGIPLGEYRISLGMIPLVEESETQRELRESLCERYSTANSKLVEQIRPNQVVKIELRSK
jgi:hypothetical protein